MMIVYLAALSVQKPFRSNDNVTPGRYKRFSECFLMDSPPRQTEEWRKKIRVGSGGIATDARGL